MKKMDMTIRIPQLMREMITILFSLTPRPKIKNQNNIIDTNLLQTTVRINQLLLLHHIMKIRNNSTKFKINKSHDIVKRLRTNKQLGISYHNKRK